MSCFVPCAILGTLAQLRETRCCVVFGAAGSIHYISIFCIFSFASTFNIPLFMLLAPRFTRCTLKLYIARPPRHTLSSASHFQPCLHTLHPALHIPNPTFPVLYLRVLQSTPNLPHFPRNTPPSPFHTFHSTLYVPHVPLHIPHFAPRAHTRHATLRAHILYFAL